MVANIHLLQLQRRKHTFVKKALECKALLNRKALQGRERQRERERETETETETDPRAYSVSSFVCQVFFFSKEKKGLQYFSVDHISFGQ